MKIILFLMMTLLVLGNASAKEYQLVSPAGKLAITITVTEEITYAVALNDNVLIAPSEIALQLEDGTVWGQNEKVRKTKTHSVSQELRPVVRRKNAVISDVYNQLNLLFKDHSLEFRAYDEGVAYRWVSEQAGEYKVKNEVATFAFPGDRDIWFPEEESMMSHQERDYLRDKLSNIGSDRFGSTGMLVDNGDGVKIYISESGLLDYPGMFLTGDGFNPHNLTGLFAGVVLKEEALNDRDIKPVQYANYIAECRGPRVFPWRVLLITENDADLVHSNLIYKLAPEQKIDNTDWIKPGKVAWDWWNANNIYGVDFESGINTATYKYYIDFASEYGLDYIILDEGWYHLGDVLDVVDEIDVQELVDYGKEKNVGVILWVVWKAMDDKLTEALEQFKAWGVKGIKMDFMQRDDQWMVNFYEKVARECAARQLLVDYHGAYKPCGLDRAYPNVISYEGVKGLEQAKWSNMPDPEHNVTLPFIRMVAGAMDFTPGAMKNATKENFRDVFSEPMSPGTRCHQLGMYVIFESPLQMLADNPSNYYREPECMEFLSVVPTVWDDTKVLAAKVSDYIAVARRSEDTWYVGAMTDWDSRTLDLKLDFLDNGNYTMKIWKDGVNATKHAADFVQENMEVNANSNITINMAPGGGWVAIIQKK